MRAPAAPSRPGWFGSLKVRLMLASALVIGASVVVSTGVVLAHVKARSEEAVMGLERDNTEHMAALLGQRVVVMQNMLRLVAQGMPEGARTEPGEAAAFLQSKPGLLAVFSTLFIAGTAGPMLALTDGHTAGPVSLNLADREAFRQVVARGVPVVSAPVPGRVSKEPVILLLMPVFDPGHQLVAVLGGSMRLGSRNLLDDLTYGGRGGEQVARTIVTDAQGTIISHPQRQRVMGAIASEPQLARAVARWVAQGRPLEPTGSTLHEGGEFITMAAVPGADWMVFRLTPDTALLGGLAQAWREGLAWAGGVAVLGGLVVMAVLALLLGPLTRLRRRAQRLQDPALALDEGWPEAGGEIGELSQVLQRVLRERALGEQAKHALLQQVHSVLAAAPVGIAFTRGERFELVGAEFNALLGWAEGALIGRPVHEIFAGEGGLDEVALRAAAAAGRTTELPFRRCDGSTFWGRLQGRLVDAADPAEGTIWLLEDVTEEREAHARLSWSAHHDTLTRLLNRGAFEERLAEWVRNPRPGVPASLLFIDLDRFKRVNDCAGHAAGDAVLREVAAVLQAQVRTGDAAARLGGDEFALLLPGCVAAVALQIAERLRSAITLIGVDHGGRRVTIGASVGVVEIDAAGTTAAGVWLARADAACYAAKHGGRDAVRLAATEPLSRVG